MPETDEASTPTISALRSSPERVVFVESGNTDGWIASDLTAVLDAHR